MMPPSRAATLGELRPELAARLSRLRQELLPQGFGAPVGIVLGSGLGPLVTGWPITAELGFDAIEGLHRTSVPGHGGRLLQLRAPRPAVLLAGRLHAYEGHSFADVVHPIALLSALGCRVIVLSNAAGGLRLDLEVGDFMALTDLVDLHLHDPLRGMFQFRADEVEVPLRGATHVEVFDRELTQRLIRRAQQRGLALRVGTYASVFGPSYETKSEIGFLRLAKADAVGMSTGPEAVMARALGARVVGISCITNLAREASASVVTHDEVVQVGAARRHLLGDLLLDFLADLDDIA